MTQEEKKIVAAEVTMKVYRRLTDDQYIVDLGGYPCLGVEIHCYELQEIFCGIVRNMVWMMSKGERGRIPNAIKEMVDRDIRIYGFGLAWHYFAYSVAWGSELSRKIK